MVLIGNLYTVQVDIYLAFLGAFALVFVFTLYVSLYRRGRARR